MNGNLQEQIYKKYPEIFLQKDLDMQQTCMCWGLECGDGWYLIIDTLCSSIQNFINRHKGDQQRYADLLKESTSEHASFYAKELNQLIENPVLQVQATQVKEKYGSLRFYINGSHPVLDAYIEFAESMSEITCELCGNPGTMNDGGWLQVRCEEHKEF